MWERQLSSSTCNCWWPTATSKTCCHKLQHICDNSCGNRTNLIWHDIYCSNKCTSKIHVVDKVLATVLVLMRHLQKLACCPSMRHFTEICTVYTCTKTCWANLVNNTSYFTCAFVETINNYNTKNVWCQTLQAYSILSQPLPTFQGSLPPATWVQAMPSGYLSLQVTKKSSWNYG